MYKLTGLARKTDNRLEPVCPKIMDLEMCGYYHPLFIRSCSLLVSNISQCVLVILYGYGSKPCTPSEHQNSW